MSIAHHKSQKKKRWHRATVRYAIENDAYRTFPSFHACNNLS